MRVVRSRRRLRPVVACAAAVALSGIAATIAPAAPRSALVTVNDFYFGPSAVTIRKGGTVKWVWSAANAYPHDVHLRKGPKGLKNRASYSTRTSAVTEARFRKKFETAGTYRYVCTIHPTLMRMTVTVKR
jgi:plastocyanin